MTVLLRRMVEQQFVDDATGPGYTKDAIMASLGSVGPSLAIRRSDTTRPWTKASVSGFFVDTSAFYALANLADAHHLEAVQAFEANVGVDRLTTSDHGLVEPWFCRGRAWDGALRRVSGTASTAPWLPSSA